MKGSESFIESNFNKTQDLLVESFGVKRKMVVSRKTHEEPISNGKLKEFKIFSDIKRRELSEASPISPVVKFSIPEYSHELKAKRPPLRKYIRKEGMPGNQKIVVEVFEQKSSEISIAALKEKFGLSDSKIGGIIRDAEKLGKIKRVMNGSYSWT